MEGGVVHNGAVHRHQEQRGCRKARPVDLLACQQEKQDQRGEGQCGDPHLVRCRWLREQSGLDGCGHKCEGRSRHAHEVAIHAAPCDHLQRLREERQHQQAHPQVIDPEVVDAEAESRLPEGGDEYEQPKRDSGCAKDALVRRRAFPELGNE